MKVDKGTIRQVEKDTSTQVNKGKPDKGRALQED